MRNCREYDSKQLLICNFCSKYVFTCQEIKEIFGKCSKLSKNVHFYCRHLFEHGYSESISSGWEFQFFGTHFMSKGRMDMRVGTFESSQLSWKFLFFFITLLENFYTTLKLMEIHFLAISCHENDVISKFLTSKISKKFQNFFSLKIVAKLFLHVFAFSLTTFRRQNTFFI